MTRINIHRSSMASLLGVAVVGAGLAALPTARAGGPVLELAFPDGIVCLKPGDIFRVLVELTEIPPGEPAAGFQAFIEYDPAKAAYVTGSYTLAPFGLPVMPIVHSIPTIDMAAGINLPAAQPPTTADSLLAELIFVSIDGDPDDVVWFRTTNPTTKVSDLGGTPIEPLTLIDLYGFSGNITGDLNGDGVVDGADLGILLNNWGRCVPINVECLGDLDCNGVVDGADLGILLNQWTF